MIAVMYAGRIVEHGPAARVLSRPIHPTRADSSRRSPISRQPAAYGECRASLSGSTIAAGLFLRAALRSTRPTLRLEGSLVPIASAPPVRSDASRRHEPPHSGHRRVAAGPTTYVGVALLTVEHLSAGYGGPRDEVLAAQDISFAPRFRRVLGARWRVGLWQDDDRARDCRTAPAIRRAHPLGGQPLAPRAKDRPPEVRRRCQIIFQNPYESLNPRHRILDEIARPARILRKLSKDQARTEVADLLERVRLPARFATRFPSELSGGERQRVAIARALAAAPEVLVCDEITAALDVSVQAAVLELLAELRRDLSLSLLFITHDLGVVAAIADRVIVLHDGHICEHGAVETVFRQPVHERTKELLASAPRLLTSASTLVP